jgi:hypothetical protein
MEARRRSEVEGQYEPVGWCTGSDEFRKELLAQVNQLASPRHAGEEIRESAQAKADRIIKEELKLAGWNSEELNRRRKGDRQKIKIALRLRRETTMTLAWIADRLQMGSPGHLSCLLYRRTETQDGRGTRGDQQIIMNKLF